MAYIYKTYSSGGTNNQKKFTASVWVKRCATGVQHEIASAYKASNGFQTDLLKFNSDDTLRFYSHSDSAQGATSFITNAKFRDTNAWYHIVLNVDTTQSTQSERFKMWVNGEQITSWSTSTYPAQNNSFIWGMPTDAVHQIGALNGSNTFNGLMSHFHYVQNANYAPTVFGEYDANGVWKIIVEPTGITYSDQSFWFFKNDNLATDRSGNGNNWSTNGTLTKTEDNPSNVFATMNPLVPTTSLNFSNGNTTLTGTNATNYGSNNTSTLGASSGKYYFEIEYDTAGSNVSPSVGISPISTSATTNPTAAVSDVIVVTMQNQIYVEGTNSASYLGSTPTTGDIIQIALDMDNGKVFFGLNGTFVGDPVAGTGGAFSGITSGETIALNIRPLDAVFKCNFGNGYFGTTAVASAQNPDDGIGIFEYSVPTGYKALCTKSINAQEYS